MADVRVYPDLETLVQAAGGQFVSLAAEAITSRGVFSVMLSGGSTPRAFHERLTDTELTGKLDWQSVYVFWGDERCVPPDHPDSNYRMARETLLDHIPIPLQNIHRIRGELSPREAAVQYEQELHKFFQLMDDRSRLVLLSKRKVPAIDLILLGMGDDGHIASLFPDSTALLEKDRWVTEVEHTEPPPPLVSRVTVTPVMINAASHVLFLITGTRKADRLRQVLNHLHQPKLLPAQVVRPADGQLTWMVDRAAAARIAHLLP